MIGDHRITASHSDTTLERQLQVSALDAAVERQKRREQQRGADPDLQASAPKQPDPEPIAPPPVKQPPRPLTLTVERSPDGTRTRRWRL